MNNKIIIIGIVFILLFTINFSLNNSHASLNALYQVPIILVNNENVSTPNPFQQMIQLNESNYKGYIIYNGSFANFEFVYNNGSIIPAWIESNNSGKLIIWLKINSIPASDSETIYLDIFPLYDNLLNPTGKNGIGEAPQLSSTYGEYDNGANVFNFYDNFAGTSLNTNKWTQVGTGYSINNGFIFQTPGTATDNNYLQSVDSFSLPIITEAYIYPTNGGWIGFSQIGTYTSGGVLAYYFPLQNGWELYQGSSQLHYTGNDAENTYYIMGETMLSDGTALLNVNYVNLITSSSGYFSGTTGNLYVGSNGGTGTMYWIRTRAYPPNGVMPTVNFGSLTSITKISKSEEMNIHTKIYALNLSLPNQWGVYGFFNYTIYGKNYSIPISNLTNNYYLNLSISYSFSIYNNTTLSYNLSLFAYKLQDYIAINHLNYKGRLNVTINQKEYNITFNDSIIKFENVNNFYYFWNQYGYKVIGSVIIIGLFLFFISRLRRMR